MKKIRAIIAVSLVTLFLSGCGAPTPAELIENEIIEKKIVDKKETVNLLGDIYSKTDKNINSGCSAMLEPKTNIDKAINSLTVELCKEKSNIDERFTQFISNISSIEKFALIVNDIKIIKWIESGFSEEDSIFYISNKISLEEAKKISTSILPMDFIKAFIKNGIVTAEAINYFVGYQLIQSIKDIELFSKAGITSKLAMQKWEKLKISKYDIYEWVVKAYSYEKAKEWVDLKVYSPANKLFKSLARIKITTANEYKQWLEIINSGYDPVRKILEWKRAGYSVEDVKVFAQLDIKSIRSGQFQLLKKIKLTSAKELKKWVDIKITNTYRIVDFVKNNYTADKVKNWAEIGVTSEGYLKTFLENKIKVEEAKDWLKINVKKALTIVAWKKTSYNTPEKVAELQKAGYEVTNNRPETIIRWKEAGIKDDTKEWEDAGVKKRKINNWRATGIEPSFVKENQLSKYKPHGVKALLDKNYSAQDIKTILNTFRNSYSKFFQFNEVNSKLTTEEIIKLYKKGISVKFYKTFLDYKITDLDEIIKTARLGVNRPSSIVAYIEVFNKDIKKYTAYTKPIKNSKVYGKFGLFLYAVEAYKKSNTNMTLEKIEKLAEIGYKQGRIMMVDHGRYIENNKSLETAIKHYGIFKKYNVKFALSDAFAIYGFSTDDLEYILSNKLIKNDKDVYKNFNRLEEYARYLSVEKLMSKLRTGNVKVDEQLAEDYKEEKRIAIEKYNKKKAH